MTFLQGIGDFKQRIFARGTTFRPRAKAGPDGSQTQTPRFPNRVGIPRAGSAGGHMKTCQDCDRESYARVVRNSLIETENSRTESDYSNI